MIVGLLLPFFLGEPNCLIGQVFEVAAGPACVGEALVNLGVRSDVCLNEAEVEVASVCPNHPTFSSEVETTAGKQDLVLLGRELEMEQSSWELR